MSIAELLNQYGDKYLLAVMTTWKLTAISFLAAFILGIAITVMRISPVKPLRAFGEFFVQIFRNIPGVSLLILLVYALPYLNIVLPYFNCVVIATTLIPAAFCSEYLMSGINMIDIGQIEASRALGFSFMQIVSLVVVPQALRSSVLSLTNLLVATMLTTALASQVPLNPMDLTGLVAYINTHSVGGITPFIISAFFYCLSAVLIGTVGNYIDKKVRIRR
ncbi:MAG: ABC transporter permease subunit [Lachnospiraceae bacterium]|nr:ABC transporter permease subunit [Lachnospiraceae bacterium]MDN4744335.1 ABC transporter permease subunit [Lachnospiraceae bacterium C1.1]